MKLFTVAVTLCLLFALQSALAAEVSKPAAPSATDGMGLAEQILLREDLSEPVPAKEEKVDQKKRATEDDDKGDLQEAPLVAGEVESEDGDSSAMPAASPTETAKADQVMDSIVPQDKADDQDAPKDAGPAPGSMQYEMDTVSLLADAPAPLESHQKLAKR